MSLAYCQVTETTIFGPLAFQPGLMTIIVWTIFLWLEFESFFLFSYIYVHAVHIQALALLCVPAAFYCLEIPRMGMKPGLSLRHAYGTAVTNFVSFPFLELCATVITGKSFHDWISRIKTGEREEGLGSTVHNNECVYPTTLTILCAQPPAPSQHLSLRAASRTWIRHRSVVIVALEGGLEFSAGLTKKIVFYSCHG